MFIARIVFVYKVLSPQMCLFNVCFFMVIFFYHASFVFKFLTSKVVEGVYSCFKSSRVCSLPKTALFWKSIWFIANSNWWFLKSPTKQKIIKFLFHLPPNPIVYRVALIMWLGLWHQIPFIPHVPPSIHWKNTTIGLISVIRICNNKFELHKIYQGQPLIWLWLAFFL
jgi:hypothetical protein